MSKSIIGEMKKKNPKKNLHLSNMVVIGFVIFFIDTIFRRIREK